MKKTVAAVMILATLTPTLAHADDWRHHGPRPGYGGGNWVAPLVGGMIIGGIVGGALAQQPRYDDEVYFHTECRREQVFDRYGNFLGWQRQCYRVPNQ